VFVPRKKLIIELDGSQHLEQEEYDEERSAYLKSKGYHVLRFWNKDVMKDINTVLSEIWNTVKEQNETQS
jgi:very-short-patch-repair endonuclease